MSLRCVFPLVILYPGVPVSKLYCVFEWRETAINSVIWILNWILSNPSFLSWTHKEVTLVILHNSRRRCVIFVFYFIMETKFCWPGILHSLCSLETQILRSNSMVYKLLHQGVNFLYLQICYRNNEIRDEKILLGYLFKSYSYLMPEHLFPTHIIHLNEIIVFHKNI